MKKVLLFFAVLFTLTSSFDASAQKKPKKEKGPKKTVAQLVVELERTRPSGDVDIDLFVVSSVNLARSFKEMSDEWQNIAIEVKEVEDQGDGVTTAVVITDAQGNPRDKEAIEKANAERVENLASMSLQSAALLLTGTNLVASLINQPTKAISMAFAVKQMKLCVQALDALAYEIPIFAENVKTQNALIAQAKQM